MGGESICSTGSNSESSDNGEFSDKSTFELSGNESRCFDEGRDQGRGGGRGGTESSDKLDSIDKCDDMSSSICTCIRSIHKVNN